MAAAKKTAVEATETEAPIVISKGLQTANNVAALLKARNTLLWVNTREEARVERFLIDAAIAATYKTFFWDVARGITDISGREPTDMKGKKIVFSELGDKTGSDFKDPGEALGAVELLSRRRSRDDAGNEITDPKKVPERVTWIFRDLPIWIDERAGTAGATPLRQLRNLAKDLHGVERPAAQAIIILTTSSKVPSDLSNDATVIDWPLPDRSEIAKALDGAILVLPEYATDPKTGEYDKTKPIRSLAITPETRELAIDAAVGLTEGEAQSCYAKSLVQTRRIDPNIVVAEKKLVISKAGVLEWIEPIEGGLDAIGGLEEFKEWITEIKEGYSADAKAYGLQTPKGVVAVGVQGCGKSAMANAIPSDWNIPCVRLDLGALKGKYLGDSEGAIRKALATIEAMGRVAVWIDEIEKALAGSASGASDGGVASDQLGVLLNWLQERKTEAFVIATANNTDALPPELLRTGRFDAIFGVDVPNSEEVVAVLKTALKKAKRHKLDIDHARVAKACTYEGFGFIGAEIAGLVPAAMRKAFKDGKREITTEDLIEVAQKIVPLTKTKKADVEKIRQWIGENARPATRVVTKASQLKAASTERLIDLD